MPKEANKPLTSQLDNTPSMKAKRNVTIELQKARPKEESLSKEFHNLPKFWATPL
jgi:hypothetical protein